MVYDSKLGKGVRRKSFPEPNPSKIEISKNASPAKELYFFYG